MLAEILKYPACFSTAHLEKEKIEGKMGKKKAHNFAACFNLWFYEVCGKLHKSCTLCLSDIKAHWHRDAGGKGSPKTASSREEPGGMLPASPAIKPAATHATKSNPKIRITAGGLRHTAPDQGGERAGMMLPATSLHPAVKLSPNFAPRNCNRITFSPSFACLKLI